VGCEIVLGELPPVKQHTDGGIGGTGGSGGATVTTTATTTSTATGGATSTSTSSITGTGGEGGCCDCDGDGALAEGVCGGMDCDDHDKRAYPGEQVYYGFPNPDPAIGFDWDCNGVPEPNPALSKAVDCPPVGLPCPAGIGFLDKTPPPCGESKPWGSCNQDGLGCVKAVIEAAKVMTCK
jgi:hypothetical protein